MKTPILIPNLKTNQAGTGEKALELAKAAEKVSKETDASIVLAVQPTDIYRITQEVSIPIISQHTDPVEFGSHTGHILPEAVKEAGAIGTLINHSERRVPEQVGEIVKRCKEVGLKTIVCAESVEEAEKFLIFNPDFIALETPELIGTLQSISKLEPESVKKFAELLSTTDVIPLCGAGVANAEDVKAAIQLGTKGALVATAIVKAENQEQALREMVQGLV